MVCQGGCDNRDESPPEDWYGAIRKEVQATLRKAFMKKHKLIWNETREQLETRVQAAEAFTSEELGAFLSKYIEYFLKKWV